MSAPTTLLGFYHTREVAGYCPAGVQGTVLGIAVDLSAPAYFLHPFPGPYRAGVPGRLVLVGSDCASWRRAVSRGLDTMTPNQVLGDIMIDDTYRDDDEKEEKKEKKDEKKDEKKKSVAFKATSSKGKAKQESSSEDEDLSFDEMDDEKMTLFVKRLGKFIVKKRYHARRKNQEDASSMEARVILLLNVHTIETMMMMTKRTRRRTRRKRKRRKTR